MLDWHHLASDGSICMNPHTCKPPAARRDWPQNSEWPTLGACEAATIISYRRNVRWLTVRTKWWQMPLARVPSGRRREEPPPCWSADEGKRGVNRKELSGPGRGGRHGVRRNAPTREQRKRRPGRGRGEGCRLTLVADGVVPEGAGALVLHALEVALPGGGGVLELLVAVVAVVLPQGHRVGCWQLWSHWEFPHDFLQKNWEFPLLIRSLAKTKRFTILSLLLMDFKNLALNSQIIDIDL